MASMAQAHTAETSGTAQDHSATKPAKNIHDLAIQTPRAAAYPHINHLPVSRGGSLNRDRRRSLGAISRTSSFNGSVAGGSPKSGYATPLINAITDMTPLPSPILPPNSAGWKTHSRTSSKEFYIPGRQDSVSSTKSGLHVARRKPYSGLSQSESAGDGAISENDPSTRSVSNYVPIHLKHKQTRIASAQLPEITTSEAEPTDETKPALHREHHYAKERGIKPTINKPPTPPRSSRGGESDDECVSRQSSISEPAAKPDIYTATVHRNARTKHWRSVQFLGEGTFSKVYLAAETDESTPSVGISSPIVSSPMSMRSTVSIREPALVAVKIIEHGPSGGASADRIATSLKRELEILRLVHHPSLVHCIASQTESARTLVVMQYCAGGDLFTFASEQSTQTDNFVNRTRSLKLTHRIFAEMAGAVDYLHKNNIIHRDIKLENVLLNIPSAALQAYATSQEADVLLRYREPIITLTDMGLSKVIDPANPTQTTRCGSEDYAAPELLMGLDYDGRSTDCWALGVILYALLEGRLPFDPPVNRNPSGMAYALSEAEIRRKTLHRIARIEWSWIKFYENGDDSDDDDDGLGKSEAAYGMDAVATKSVRDAKQIVVNLFRRGKSRWSSTELMDNDWVKAASPKGGLQFSSSMSERDG